MLCKKCMAIMETGTTYEQKKDGKSLARRFYKCKKCHSKVYTKEYNFQEYVREVIEKWRNK